MLNLTFPSANMSILNYGSLTKTVAKCIATGQYSVHYTRCPRFSPMMLTWGLAKKEKGWYHFNPTACEEYMEEVAKALLPKEPPKDEYISPLPPLQSLDYSPRQGEVRLALKNGQPRKFPR